ncbi:MAG: hypothetical protein GTN69_11710, partial [Armatimonadetes bacterium]|nr:hypothetical protein [Armatimonadota bacterium]
GSVWHNDFSLSAAKYYLKHIASDGSPLHTLDLGGNPTDFVVVNSGNGDCWRINGSWLFGYTNQAVNKANRYVGIPIKSASTNSADGTVWVAAYDAANGGHVIHYPSGSSGGALWDGTGFTEPSCVSVYSADGSVWVAQPSTNEVIHLAADGSESWRGDTF